MNPPLRLFLATLLGSTACIGGDDGTDPQLLDDTICTVVPIGDDCPGPAEAEALLVGSQTCEDPVREVLATGDLVSEDTVGITSYGYTEAFDTSDTGADVQTRCCYEASTKELAFGCTPGRPLMVDGLPMAAEARLRGDWAADLHPDLRGLSTSQRAQLADAWLRDALLEHASVPAFARVVGELAAHGAPATLLARTARAMADEVEHARACFAIASAYAQRDLGPGPVAAPPRPMPTLAALAVDTFLEGCVGETLAAGRAALQLRDCEDPVLREVLATIVRDESAHAELAWDIVRWALAVGGDDVGLALSDALDALELTPEWSAGQPTLRSHGLPDTRELRQTLQRVLVDVVEPLARDMLAA